MPLGEEPQWEWDRSFDRLDQVYALSIEELELEIGKYPDDIELKEKLAAVLFDRYLYGEESQKVRSEADMERLREIVRDLPQDKALHPRAFLAQHDGKQEESIEWLVKYVTAFSQKEDEPFNSEELYFWIVFPFTLSKESSLRLANALCENWPGSPAVFALQGLAKTFDEKAWEDAIDDFVLALSKDEEYWLAAWLCAEIYYDQKNWRAARNYFYKALKSQTAQRLSDIHFELAWSLGKLKAYPDEEKHYRLCLEFDPDFPYARNNLGWSLHKQGRYLEQDIYRGKLTKFAQQEIAGLEVIMATEKADLLLEEPGAECEEDIDDTDDLSTDDESEAAEPKPKLSRMPSIAPSERWLESMIEEQIQKDNVAFGRRLKMYDRSDGYGRQYPIPAVGRIDLLVEDMETDDLVVIELKKGQFGAQASGLRRTRAVCNPKLGTRHVRQDSRSS